MKDLINIAVVIAMAAGSTAAIRTIHDVVRNAALEKAAQGLPSLEKITKSLRAKTPKKFAEPNRCAMENKVHHLTGNDADSSPWMSQSP